MHKSNYVLHDLMLFSTSKIPPQIFYFPSPSKISYSPLCSFFVVILTIRSEWDFPHPTSLSSGQGLCEQGSPEQSIQAQAQLHYLHWFLTQLAPGPISPRGPEMWTLCYFPAFDCQLVTPNKIIFPSTDFCQKYIDQWFKLRFNMYSNLILLRLLHFSIFEKYWLF